MISKYIFISVMIARVYQDKLKGYGIDVLQLTGYGVKLRVHNLKSRSELQVTDRQSNLKDNPLLYTFSPRKIPYGTIIIDSHSALW